MFEEKKFTKWHQKELKKDKKLEVCYNCAKTLHVVVVFAYLPFNLISNI